MRPAHHVRFMFLVYSKSVLSKMKWILALLWAVFFVTPGSCQSVISHPSQYLDYGSSFHHPLYQVHYSMTESAHQDNPDVFLFLCGRGMSVEMYQEWVEEFVACKSRHHSRGVVVYVMNFPGQIVVSTDVLPETKSKGWQGILHGMKAEMVRHYRGSIKNYNEYILAVNAMVDFVYAKHKQPIILGGHSMGGHVALRYALHLHQAFQLNRIQKTEDYLRLANKQPMALEVLRGPVGRYNLLNPTALIRGVVLVSPMFDINTGSVNRSLARALAWTASFTGLGAAYIPGAADYDAQRDSFHGDKQTSCELGYKKLKELRKKYGVPQTTYAWLTATFDAIEYLQKADFSNFSIPVFATLAEDEHIVLNSGATQILERIKTAEIYHLQGMHTPFVESPQIRDTLAGQIHDFLDHLADLPTV